MKSKFFAIRPKTANTEQKTGIIIWLDFIFDFPARITSDRALQFESKLFSSLLKSYGITRHPTSANNPKENGMV